MNKATFRAALFLSLLTGGFVLLDLFVDRHFFGLDRQFGWSHFILIASVLLISYVMLSRAMESHTRAEAVLRQARDEMEARVRERTAELEQANAALRTEVAERQRVEQALRDSEERYRVLFDDFPEPVTVWDRDGVLLMQNLVSARNLGGEREDYLGKSMADIFGAAATAYVERVTHVIDTGVSEEEEDVVELRFGQRYFWTVMQRVQNPHGQYAAQVISYDITDRRRAEEALEASEEKFATVFHQFPDPLVIYRTADSTILDINEAGERLAGISSADIIGRTWSELSLIPAVEGQSQLAELFRANEWVAEHELDYTADDGEIASMLVSLIPIMVGGEPCALTFLHDITRRKRSEAALRQAQTELMLGIQERSVLEERQRLARDLHDSVSQAIYGLSLGANTALTLFDTDRTKALEALNYTLGLAHTALVEMRALIFELRPDSLERDGLVLALSRHLEALEARHGIEVGLSLCQEPDVSYAVKEAVYRIALEAVQNAVKHARPSRLDVLLTCAPDSLTLEVCDNGTGFEPLADYAGHLGLRSMRERAQRMDGTLDIISAAGNGTQIRAQIPIPVTQTA